MGDKDPLLAMLIRLGLYVHGTIFNFTFLHAKIAFTFVCINRRKSTYIQTQKQPLAMQAGDPWQPRSSITPAVKSLLHLAMQSCDAPPSFPPFCATSLGVMLPPSDVAGGWDF